ncbi:MAG TPA: ABC transporter substrate-binding protein [Ktedonobacteraceae bacterium]|nr:ABC transporter substrate-binding protein [Ktedonobacteraceae bacterium]
MHNHHRLSFVLSFLLVSTVLEVLVTACGGSGTSNGNTSTTGCKSPATVSTAASNPPANQLIPLNVQNHKAGGAVKALQNVSIGLGYIPDIQFAPFYVAKSKGYYAAAGLNVTLNHGIVNNLLAELALGHNTFAFAGGDELLVARSQHLPLIDVSTIFQKYPVSLIVPVNSPICTLADLKGHTIGEPGPFGATYIGLLALLYHAHLTLSDVHAESIGFTQVAALVGHKVDAVMGYSNNEALQLPERGFPVRTFNVSDYQPLVSNGIIVTESTWQTQPQLVRSFVQATIQGLQEVIANPSEAVQISKSYVPGMNATTAMSVLQATIPIWKGDGKHPLGYNNGATWQSMQQFLVAEKIIPSAQDLSQAFTNVSTS